MIWSIGTPEQMRDTGPRIPEADREPPHPRVLIVAEDECIRQWAQRRLLRVGFEVFATGSAVDALRVTHEEPPDLIVVGQIAGWLDVGYLLTLLRRDARTSGTPVLIITLRADDDLSRARAGPAPRWLSAPDLSPQNTQPRSAADAPGDRRS